MASTVILEVTYDNMRRNAELWVEAIERILEAPDRGIDDPSAEGKNPPRVPSSGTLANPNNMTADEAAQYLRIPKSSLYKGTSAGKIPHRKVGKLLRFSQKELDEYFNSRKVMTGEERDKAAESKLGELRKKRRL